MFSGASPAARPVNQSANELNLWDDYGIAVAPVGVKIDPDAPRSEQISQLLGATAIPTAKVLSFLAVLGVTGLVLVALALRLITLDSLVVARQDRTPTVSSTPTSPTPTPTSEPETSSTPEPAPAPVPSSTPVMAPGAKQCDPGVWAAAQTSCTLANAVAKQVRTDMTGSVVIEAFSSASNRNYRLECVAGQGITCNGLDGVEGLHVWIVTPGR